MVATTRNSSTSNKKDFSKLYKKTEPKIVPINVPDMGLDIELEYTAPSSEAEVIFDQYIIAVAKAIKTNDNDASFSDLIPSDDQLLAYGRRQLIDFVIYLKKITTLPKADALAKESDGIKNAKLIDLRDRMMAAINDLKAVTDPSYDDYEKLGFFMVTDPVAKELSHRAIGLCFKEIEAPERLENQVKFYLMMGLLSITNRVVAM
jgi:hypothetical protein